jgi:hypothetical protein
MDLKHLELRVKLLESDSQTTVQLLQQLLKSQEELTSLMEDLHEKIQDLRSDELVIAEWDDDDEIDLN